jgi:hypothetical protein
MKRLVKGIASVFVLAAFLISVVDAGINHGINPTTINNYQPGALTLDKTTRVTHHATNGNAIDAHAGNMLQVGTKNYFYGETHACGFHPETAGGPSCGIAVYSSDDFMPRVFEGYLFDITAAPWPTNCTSQTGSGNFTGCYSPKMIYNAKNNNYVLEIFVSGATPATNSFAVFTCTSPTCGATPTTPGIATQQANMTFPVTTPEAPSYCVTPNGVNAYVAFTDVNNFNIYVMALNSDFTQTTGSATNTGATGEGLGIFGCGGGGLTYVLYGGGNCAYCATAILRYVSAASPLGSYGAPTVLSTDSCQGQPRDVAVFTANGITSQVYMSDTWWSQGTDTRANQGFAGVYFHPLSFTGSAINSFTCSQVVSIPGTQNTPIKTFPGGTPDQSDIGDVFQDWCDITPTTPRMHTFVPVRSTLNSYSTPIGKNNTACALTAGGCAAPDGSLTISLVTVNGSNNPGTTLASCTYAASSLKWAPQWTNCNFGGVADTPGLTYGITLTSTNTIGCFGTSINQVGPPYPGSVARHSTDSGATWVTDAGKHLFATY